MFSLRTCCFIGLLGLATLVGLRPGDARAQQVYRIVGPDGRVTFSDKPPLDPNARATAEPVVPPATGTGTGDSALPFELRQVTSRYPVLLYTGPGCAPCGAGRAMLSNRGIPFTEKTVTTNDDIDALSRLAGAPTLPTLTIGAQQLKGYSEVEWTQFLDAAGYPKTSQLPAGYHTPPATPLVVAHEPPAPARPSPTAQRAPVASPAPETAPADNPAGIRF
jgi:glutaredoxin